MSVTIRKFNQTDIPYKIKWINDVKNHQYLHYDLPLTYEKTCQWFHRIKKQQNRYDCTIEVNGTPVGLIGLLQIDRHHKKAEFYITIGEQTWKGRGVAKKAGQLLLADAFGPLALNKVYLYTETENITAQRLFAALGFQKEGLLAQDICHQGRLIDRFVYGLSLEAYKKHRMGFVSEPNHMFYPPTPLTELHFHFQQNQYYMKRDDLYPISFGGNKARKNRLFFQDILEKQSDCVVTYGSSSSNHCRVVANMAYAMGLPCYIISPSEGRKVTTNGKLISLCHGQVLYCPVAEVAQTIENVMEQQKAQGKRPYFIPGGGHGLIGTKAYVECYEELKMQEEHLGCHFDYIFLTSGTGTTQAGLVCGALLHQDKREIIGISNARKNPYGRNVVLESVEQYFNDLGRMDLFDESAVQLIDGYLSGGYGKSNVQIDQTIQKRLQMDGIPLDATYTGKAFWGMEEYLKQKKIFHKCILFLHTGGLPLFFDDLERMV